MKVVFLDRDGVINKDFGYVYRITDFVFIEGIIETCKKFQRFGYNIVVVTNQSGIARGYYQDKDFHELTNWMKVQFGNEGVEILDVLYCPHGPQSMCSCRKPQPGMLVEACEKYAVNIRESWLIGDKETDIQAAHAAGVENTILLNSQDNGEKVFTKAKFMIGSIWESIGIVT